MDQQRIIFELSPAYILLCAALGIGSAFFLYRAKHPWSKTWNNVLFAIRATLSSLLLFLLLGPIVKQINNLYEKPLFVLVYDHSISVKEATDSMSIRGLESEMSETANLLREKGYDVKTIDLDGTEIERPVYTGSTSDITGALKMVANRYESSQLGGVILASDGIYNDGISPLYASYNFPVYTIGLGDTTQRTDVYIKDIAFNKIVYQGNKFPLHVEVMVKNLNDESINITLSRRGKVLEQQTKAAVQDQLLVFDFQPMAEEKGIQKLDIQVEVKEGEYNTVNNKASVFIDVVEGKKKILMVAASPHPDIKAIREVVDKNPNYEFLLHIPEIEEQPAGVLNPENIDLVIFHQSPDQRGKTREIFQRLVASNVSLFFIMGAQSDLPLLAKAGIPLAFESTPRDYDEVIPLFNPTFTHFILSAEANSIIPEYPPVSVPFGKMKIPGNIMTLLFQRVGNVSTEKPLLYTIAEDNKRIGIMLGEGLWRWKLNEFDRYEKTIAFDELFGKLIQYLSTSEDKRKFRSYPIKQEFSDTEPVVFESQVFNDIFEPVYGNTIDLHLTDEAGRQTEYTYTTSPGNTRYQIGGLKEGVYRYRSSTILNKGRDEVRGEFAVVRRQVELQNLTADFDLLRKLSSNTGGRFFPAPRFEDLKLELEKTEAKSIIHSEESYNALVNLKWVFWVLLIIVSLEWFVRKYFGSY